MTRQELRIASPAVVEPVINFVQTTDTWISMPIRCTELRWTLTSRLNQNTQAIGASVLKIFRVELLSFGVLNGV